MALSIKDPETEQLARTLAERTGETITIATRRALEERLRRIGSDARKAALLEDLAASRRRWSALPVLDNRSADEIIGYDEYGLPNSRSSTLRQLSRSHSTNLRRLPLSSASLTIPSASSRPQLCLRPLW